MEPWYKVAVPDTARVWQALIRLRDLTGTNLTARAKNRAYRIDNIRLRQFWDGEICGRQTRVEIGVALANPYNTPSPRLRGEGRGEELVRRPSPSSRRA